MSYPYPYYHEANEHNCCDCGMIIFSPRPRCIRCSERHSDLDADHYVAARKDRQ